MSSFYRITNDSKNDIFNFLSYKDLQGAAPVCSAWRDIANERKKIIHEKVGEVLKDNYNKLVDKKNVNTERRPWKKAEKIVIKNLKSGVCQILKEDSNDRMYYQIPPKLLKKLLLTTNVESVKSLHKLPENKGWIQQHEGHKKFSFPDKTFVEVLSSHFSDSDTLTIIDISDFESYPMSEFLKSTIFSQGPHTLGRETKYVILPATNLCFNCVWISAKVAGCFLGSTLLGMLSCMFFTGVCGANGTLAMRAIETKRDLDSCGRIYISILSPDENQRSHLLDRNLTSMGRIYARFSEVIKMVVKAYRDNEKLSSEESKQIQELLVDNDCCLKMYIEKISTKKPEVIRAFQTLFPQAWKVVKVD